MNICLCDRCGKAFQSSPLPPIRINLSSGDVLKRLLPEKYKALPKSDRDCDFTSRHLRLDLCPDCQDSVGLWLQTGRRSDL